jgi:hypothetical protein
VTKVNSANVVNCNSMLTARVKPAYDTVEAFANNVSGTTKDHNISPVNSLNRPHWDSGLNTL